MAKKREVQIGERFGKLSVISEIERVRDQAGRSCRVFKLQCDCGKTTTTRLINLTRGDTNSCGCNVFIVSGNISRTHGESRTRLHTCWKAMKKRVRQRKACFMYPAWNNYKYFKEWSISNGYSDNLLLCRNGDKGNYCPENSRWDTRANNSIESESYHWEITCPNGVSTVIYNLKVYCREHPDLIAEGLYDVAKGKVSHHKGYTAKKLNKEGT